MLYVYMYIIICFNGLIIWIIIKWFKNCMMFILVIEIVFDMFFCFERCRLIKNVIKYFKSYVFFIVFFIY